MPKRGNLAIFQDALRAKVLLNKEISMFCPQSTISKPPNTVLTFCLFGMKMISVEASDLRGCFATKKHKIYLQKIAAHHRLSSPTQLYKQDAGDFFGDSFDPNTF